MPVTVSQLQQAALNYAPTWFVKVRECSICCSPIGFVTNGEHLFFDSSCECTAYETVSFRPWGDAIEFIENSKNPKETAKKLFGVEYETGED